MNYKEYLQSPEWKSLRKKAIERDSGKCVFCNRKFREVHHVKYPKRFSEDHIDNLLVICEKCHRRLHGIRNDDNELMKVIINRIENNDIEIGYDGIDMSATHGYPMGDCRKNNFNFMINKFGDYLPNMKQEKFKLFSWKGSIGWCEDIEEEECKNFICGNEKENERNRCFLNWNSRDIIHWIIKNKWGKNERR